MPRRALLATVAGLALADASVVTLGLPPILRELDTTVEGVAAVLAVYTLVLALGLVPARRVEPGVALWAGGALVALGSAGAAVAGTLAVLLVARAVQAAGAALVLPAAFVRLEGGGAGRRLWLAVSVFATAAGPALGGLVTQLLSWRAIFWLQVPVAVAVALVAAAERWPRPAVARVELPAPRRALALALLAAALTAVLFLLVLLLVAGWSLSPLAAAATVSVLPLAAVLAHVLAPGGGAWRAPVGCALVAGGTVALGFLPGASAAWTLVPQALAGAGMGLALPALAGVDDAVPLAIRHAGITLALLALAPVVAGDLDGAVSRARERGVAQVLDAPLPPLAKLDVGPALVRGVDAERPRAGLRRAVAAQVAAAGDDRREVAALGHRVDQTLVTAVGEAFRTAFLITGALALLAAALALSRPRAVPALAVAVATLALVVPLAQAALFAAVAPEPPAIANPCRPRPLPSSGGLTGLAQAEVLRALDRAACRFGSSREELVLAFADDDDRAAFVRRHGVDPRSVGGILRGLGLP